VYFDFAILVEVEELNFFLLRVSVVFVDDLFALVEAGEGGLVLEL
jgi:hypothetical protein